MLQKRYFAHSLSILQNLYTQQSCGSLLVPFKNLNSQKGVKMFFVCLRKIFQGRFYTASLYFYPHHGTTLPFWFFTPTCQTNNQQTTTKFKKANIIETINLQFNQTR